MICDPNPYKYSLHIIQYHKKKFALEPTNNLLKNRYRLIISIVDHEKSSTTIFFKLYLT